MIKNHFILTRPNSSSAMKSCPRTLTPSASTLTSSNILKMDILRGFYHDVVTRLSLFFFLWETVLDIEIFSFKNCTCASTKCPKQASSGYVLHKSQSLSEELQRSTKTIGENCVYSHTVNPASFHFHF